MKNVDNSLDCLEEISSITEIQTSTSSPEKTLYLAVILQALLDATKPEHAGESETSILNRDKAKAWFFCSVGVTAEDFREVCECAGINPQYMKNFAYKVLKSKEVVFIRKRINAVLHG